MMKPSKVAKTLPFLILIFLFTGFQGNAQCSAGSVPLCGDQEVPPVNTEAHGEFIYTIEDDTLRYSLKLNNIVGVTQAHLHSAICGTNGAVVAFLIPFNQGFAAECEIIDGEITDQNLIGPLTGQSIADLCQILQNGGIYVNVHTMGIPGGEIRGQIGDVNCTCMDQCPEDPNKLVPGCCGCGIPENSGCVLIPTISQWGIIALSLILLIIGLVAVKRRQLS